MKKAAALLTSLALFGSLFITPEITSKVYAAFFDVPSSNIYYDAVNYVESNGIVSGFPDGSFGPDQTITRAAFTKIIALAVLKQEPVVAQTDCFPDVVTSDWFHPYVCWAVQNGIIDGYPDGTFKGWLEINFAEASKIISGAFNLDQSQTLINMANAAEDPWFKSYIDHLGVRHAIPLAVHSFVKNITRGEMVEMIYRIVEDITSKPSQSYETIASGKAPTISFDEPDEPIEEIVVTSMSLNDAMDRLSSDLGVTIVTDDPSGVAISNLATTLADKHQFPSSEDISTGLSAIGFNGGSSWVGTNACKTYDHAKDAVLNDSYFGELKLNYGYIGLGLSKCSDDEFFVVVIGANK